MVRAVTRRSRVTFAPGERRDISGVPVHLDYRELLARSDVNAVDIVPPNDLHTEVGVGALERGVDVLLEKPMAWTAEECDVLMAAAARSGRILSIGHAFACPRSRGGSRR